MSKRWILSESDQRKINRETDQYNLFDMPKEPLYHYTSREVFWKILEGESFLARHILFSNDFEENRIGKERIKKAMKRVGNDLAESDALPFMICFCKKKDLLSQWRGYANEGIAFEFDFSKGLYGAQEGFSSYYCYTVMNAEKEDEYLSKGDDTDELITGAIISPYEVIYTSKGDKKVSTIASRIEKIPDSDRQQYAVSMIPYIKHKSFAEEEECRLIFDMRKLLAGEEWLLSEKYVYLDVGGIKKSNIRVKFGNQEQAESKEEMVLYYLNGDLTDELEKLKADVKKENIELSLVNEKEKFPMAEDEILISEGKYQEKICTRLRRRLNQKDIKIWCDGHMPIRKIIIGPSKDAELMKASVEEYKKTKYWLKDVSVEVSQIPLRT